MGKRARSQRNARITTIATSRIVRATNHGGSVPRPLGFFVILDSQDIHCIPAGLAEILWDDRLTVHAQHFNLESAGLAILCDVRDTVYAIHIYATGSIA